MKALFLKTIVIITILLCGFLSTLADEILQFELTQEKIESAWIFEDSEGHFVVDVKLSEPYRGYLSQLTGRNIGKRLSITFSGQILISPVIKDRIDSGIIQVGEWESEENARNFMETLLPKPRPNTRSGGEKRTKTGCQQNENIKYENTPKAKKYSKMAHDSLGNYYLTNDTTYLINGLELIEKAIEADNKYVLGYYWKANMLTKLKEYGKAIITLTEGIEKYLKKEEDKIANLYFLRGVLKQKTGKKENAFDDYNKAIEIYKDSLKADAKNWYAVMNISQALILMDKKKEAVKLLNETIEKYPQEEHLKQLLEDIKVFNVINYLNNL